jgi:tRNA pseudouridine38-40 synthase
MVLLAGRNIRLEIEYEGTNYCGWQVQNSRQPSAVSRQRKESIQGIIERTLQQILQEKVKLTASGRTDAGVLAKAQVANFRTRSKIPLNKLYNSLNSILPKDIAITKIKKVPADFNSRFCAKSKTYRYTILNRAYPSALERKVVYFFPHALDMKLMKKEAKALIGKHDFSAVKAAASEKNPVKTIKKIGVIKDKGKIYIDIEADGFLYNMVRNIAGTLIDTGRGKLPAGSLKKILLSKDRRFAGARAAASGLCLIKVKY